MTKHKLFLSILILFFSFFSFSQKLQIIDIDTTNYPQMSAKFITLDENLKFVTDLTKTECEIIENGESQKVIKVVNVSEPPAMKSVVIVVDVSGSMGGTNIDLAKAAITEFINLTPFSNTEIALVSFDTKTFVNQDFTRDKNKLLKALQSLRARGGTDYNVAMTGDPGSALNLTQKRGGQEPTIIFLTDGLSSANYQNIAGIANSQKAKVHCITLNMPMPYDLAEITTQTNSLYFENISTVKEAKTAYLTILSQTFNQYSQIFWQSEPPCQTNIDYEFYARNKKYSTDGYYGVFLNKTKGIYFAQNVVGFNPEADYTYSFMTIKATSPTQITDVKLDTNAFFTIKPEFKTPHKITKTSIARIKINKNDHTHNRATNKVLVSTDNCPDKEFYIYNGNIAEFVIPGSLVVRDPNGGEVFYSGDQTTIEWINNTPNKRVTLLFSKDNGQHFFEVGNSTEKEKSWLIPGAESDQCLVKVALQSSPISLDYFSDNSTQIEVSTSGGGYYVANKNTLTKYTVGATTGWFWGRSTFKKRISNFVLSPMSDHIAVNTKKRLYVFNENKMKGQGQPYFWSSKKKKIKKGQRSAGFTKAKKVKHKKAKILNYEFSGSGNSLIVFYKREKNFFEFNPINGRRLKKHKLGSEIVQAEYRDGIASIITKGKKWIIWDVVQGKKIFELESKLGFHLSDVSQNGDFAVAADRSNNLYYWAKVGNDTIGHAEAPHKIDELKFNNTGTNVLIQTKDEISVLLGVTPVFNYKPPRDIKISHVEFTPNGYTLNYAVTEGRGRDKDYYIKKFDLQTGLMTDSKDDIYFSSEIKELSFNNIGNIAAFTEKRGTHIYMLPTAQNESSDVSDNVFTIKTLKPQILDTVYMPPVFVGSSQSYMSPNFVKNPHSNTAVLDKVFFDGRYAQKFGIMSSVPPIGIAANSNGQMEFAFQKAYNPGIYTADINALCGVDTLKSVIKIEVIKPPVKSPNAKVNLGNIKITKTKTGNFELFENISNQELEIDSIVNWGPDKEQISLTSQIKGKKFKNGEKMPFNFSFTGKNRGQTTALFLVYVKGMPAPFEVFVTGNVQAPYQISVIAEVTNVLDNSPVPKAQVVIYNGNTLVKNAKTNAEGKYKTKLPNELSYIVAVSNNSQNQQQTADLTKVFSDTTIVLKYQVLHFENGMKYSLQNGHFDLGSSTLNSDTKLELNNLAELMKKEPSISIRVDGHTDSQGDEQSNQKLSEQRANSVKKYLVQKGVDKNRIQTRGFGDNRKLSNENTEEGKQKNRRIEITINVAE